MVIFFDHQTFSLQTHGGVSRYFTELISGINHTGVHRAYAPLLFSNNEYRLRSASGVKPFLPGWQLPRKASVLYHFNQSYTRLCLRRRAYDVFHATYYDPYFLPLLNGKPCVVTIHDMIYERLGHVFKELARDQLVQRRKQLTAQRADHIIVVSEATKRDVVDWLGIDPAKISVIHLANSLVPVDHEPYLTDESVPYLLFVGNRAYYKNFVGLLQAIRELLVRYQVRLVCAGGGAFNAEEHALLRALRVQNWVVQRAIDDQTLSGLYQRAIGFLFPSYYEGFGLPVLEAFACNCPCIVSNKGSLPEVAADAALYMDPARTDSMAEAVEQLLNNAALRQTLIRKGRRRLAHFSWKKTAANTIRVYESIRQ